jgi:hypothetical protein
VTYRGKGEYDRIRKLIVRLEDDPDYDKTDIAHAWRVATEDRSERISIGVIYEEQRPDFQARIEAMRERAKATGTYTIEDMMNHFLP